MKRKTFAIVLGLILMASSTLFAQVKPLSGDMKSLKGQSVVALKYDYTKLMIGKKSADEYATEKVAEMNKKKAGSGDEWLEKWKNDRTARFQPAFQKEFNDVVKSYNLEGKNDLEDGKYTLIVYTTFIEPGFNVGVTRKDAYLNVQIDLVETANPGTVLCSVEIKKIDSKNMGGYDFDLGARVESCYEKAGSYLGKYLAKNVLK